MPIWGSYTACHRIRNADVADAPSFAQAWEALHGQFSGTLPLVAHNARFDHGALAHTLASAGLPMPVFPLHCTVRMARRLWPRPILPNHHEALSDALAYGHIAVRGLREWGMFTR